MSASDTFTALWRLAEQLPWYAPTLWNELAREALTSTPEAIVPAACALIVRTSQEAKAAEAKKYDAALKEVERLRAMIVDLRAQLDRGGASSTAVPSVDTTPSRIVAALHEYARQRPGHSRVAWARLIEQAASQANAITIETAAVLAAELIAEGVRLYERLPERAVLETVSSVLATRASVAAIVEGIDALGRSLQSQTSTAMAPGEVWRSREGEIFDVISADAATDTACVRRASDGEVWAVSIRSVPAWGWTRVEEPRP